MRRAGARLRASLGQMRLQPWAFVLFAASALCPAQAVDVRVAKAHYTRGYYSVRVSAVGNATEHVQPPLQYHAGFARKWTGKTLDTQVFPVQAGGSVLHVGSLPLNVRLPRPGGRATGLLFADPCHSSLGGMACPNGDRFKAKEKLNKVIDQLVGSDEFDYWGIVGDNFYDVFGEVTSQFFEHIGLAAKSKPFLTVPGNHDFWQSGAPSSAPGDQYGWGFLQFYGQDTVAGQAGPKPYDFAAESSTALPKADNFIFGTVVGDTGFFGYSGAHSWPETEPHARAFCAHVGKQPVNAVIVLGHWNIPNLGCTAGMDTPAVWRKVKEFPGCSEKTVLYIDGHEHCNTVTDHEGGKGPLHAAGFMIGGTGMYGNGCSEFGFAVVQSDPDAFGGPNVRVDYFKIAEDRSWGGNPEMIDDRFDDLLACFKHRGYAGCREQFGRSFRSLPAAHDCTNTKDWQHEWSDEQRKYCCEHENVGCKGCQAKCDFGVPDTCGSKAAWEAKFFRRDVSEHKQCVDYHHDLTMYCPGCAACSVETLCPSEESEGKNATDREAKRDGKEPRKDAETLREEQKDTSAGSEGRKEEQEKREHAEVSKQAASMLHEATMAIVHTAAGRPLAGRSPEAREDSDEASHDSDKEDVFTKQFRRSNQPSLLGAGGHLDFLSPTTLLATCAVLVLTLGLVGTRGRFTRPTRTHQRPSRPDGANSQLTALVAAE